MGYSPGFLLKNGQQPTLANSPEIHTNSPARSQKSICKHVAGDSGSLERFPGLTKIHHVRNHGLQPRVFAENGQFPTLGIHPKSIQMVAQGVKNLFRRVQEAFQRVWSDFQNLPKSAIFETMGYSPGLLRKIGQFPTLANSPEIDTNSPLRSQKSIQKGLGGFSESLEGFPELTKIRHVQNHGLLPRLFGQKRPISDTREFTRNRHKRSRMELEIHLEGSRRLFREFGAISRTYQNPPCSKPWAIAQGFCSKTANILPSRIHPKSTQTVPQGVRNPFPSLQEAILGVWSDFQDLSKSAMFKSMGYCPGFLLKIGQFSTLANSPEIDTNSTLRSQKSIQKGLGGFSESLERFPELTKIRHVENHGLQPRLFAQKRPIADPREFTRNPHKQSRKEL